MKKIFFSFLSLSLIITGCSETSLPGEVKNSNIVFERINFDNPSEKELKFILKNDDGSYIFDEDLEITHEKKIHFIVTKDDLAHFQHVHPEPDDQFWKVKVNFPEAGIYNVYTDFEPKDQPVRTLFITITIGDAKPDKNYPSISTDNISMQDGITASLELDHQEADRNNTLQFLLQKDGETLTTLKPYLGAGGHVVILKHNEPELYLHVHPVGNTKNDGKLKFMTKFPTPGTYTAFLQVNNSDTIQTFPFTFIVQPGTEDHSSMTTEEMESHSQ